MYGRMDTPSGTYGGSAGGRAQSANLFEMSFRNGGALHSPGLPESNTRGSFSAVEEEQSGSLSQQQQQQWPQPRKRALSSPALFWEGGNRAQGSYFDQQPPAPYQNGHNYSHSVGQDQIRQSPQQNNHQQLQTHPAMHDSIQAISALASFNQPSPSQQHQQQSQPSAAPHATRQATRAPAGPAASGAATGETLPATRGPKRQRKGSNGQQESSVSPKQEDNDELDDEPAKLGEVLGPDGKPDPMDAEAQRKDLLDRNRIAARKSREKRKREVQALENSKSDNVCTTDLGATLTRVSSFSQPSATTRRRTRRSTRSLLASRPSSSSSATSSRITPSVSTAEGWAAR